MTSDEVLERAARPAPTGDAADAELLAALRRGDEPAFAELVTRHEPAMLRLARTYVRDRAVAEEVVQETWIGVLRGIDRFEGRSSVKTWLFRILVNRAKTRALRERRSMPFSTLAESQGEDSDGGPAVDPERFLGEGHRWAGHWAAAPADWAALPEQRLLAGETRDVLRAAIEQLPPRQAQVIALRDVDGWSSEEVCAALALSEGNQRILLHRARSKVRRALERYLEEEAGG